MSHKIPTTLIPTGDFTEFVITTDSGSITVSGAFFLLGDGTITSTLATGSSVFVAGTGNAGNLLLIADSGQASPSASNLNFLVPSNSSNFLMVLGTGNNIILASTIVPTELGGTGNVFLTQNSLLYGQGTGPVGLIMPGSNGQLLLGANGLPPKFATLSSVGKTLSFTMGPNSLNIDVNFSNITFLNIIQPDSGGTGRTVLTSHGVVIGEGSLPVHVTPPGTNGQLLLAALGGDPLFATVTSNKNTLAFTAGPNSLNIDINFSGSSFLNQIPPTSGGVGRSVLTVHGVVIGEGSLSVNVTAPGTDGQVLLAATGADPQFSTLSSSGGTITFALSAYALNIDINLANLSFSLPILPPNLGGTGQTVLTSYGVLIGEGSLGVHVTNAGTNGQALIASSLGDPAFATITSTGKTLTFTAGQHSLNMEVNLSLTLFTQIPVGNGGTGQTILTSFGVLIGEGSLGIHAASPGTDGQVFLASSTGDPAFSTITSTGNTLSYTFGHNSLNIDINFQASFFSPIFPTNGGFGRTVLTTYGVIIGEGSLPVDVSAPGTDGQVLLAANMADPKFASLTSSGNTLTYNVGHSSLNIDVSSSVFSFFSILMPNYGGTGQTFLTAHGILIGEGSNPIHVTNAGTNGQWLIGATNADPTFATITSSGGTLSFTLGPHSFNLDVASTLQMTVFADSGTASPSLGFLYVIGKGAITTVATGASLLIELNTNSSFFNPLQPGNGGTGRTVLTRFGVLIGEGSNPVDVTAAGTNGQLLLAGANVDPKFGTLTSSGGTLSFTLGPNALNLEINPAKVTFPQIMPIENGGTGRTVLTSFGILIGEGSLLVNVTAAGTNGQTLIAATNADPKFANITSSSGTLTFFKGPNSLDIAVNLSSFSFPASVSRGGTGVTILTTFGVLIGEGSNSIHVSKAGTDGQAFLAATNADPKFATISSTGNTLTFSPGPNSLNIDLNLFGSSFFYPLIVKHGGLGRTILTTFGVLLGEGSRAINVTAAGTDGQTLIAGTNVDPRFASLTSTGGTLTFSFGPNVINIDINLQGTVFSPLPVKHGALGVTVLTHYGVLLGEGSLAVRATNAGTDGQALLAATNADPAFATITSSAGTVVFTPSPNGLLIDVNLFSSTFVLFPVSKGGSGTTIFTTYGVLLGEGSNDINATAAGTNGQLLIGATGFDPSFATVSSTGNTITFSPGPNGLNLEVNIDGYFNPLPVPLGGTGVTSFTPYAVICGGVSNTSSWQSIASLGTAGQVLTSNGPGALPSFQNAVITPGFSKVNILTFASLGFYTPSPGMLYCTIECVGGGGGGGGATTSMVATVSGVGGGGGGGGYCRKTFPAASIVGPQLILIGAGGTGGTGNTAGGGTGGNTSVGALLLATGGQGGFSGTCKAQRLGAVGLGGSGGVGTLGDINAAGGPGLTGYVWSDIPGDFTITISGAGGQSYFQQGAVQTGVSSDSTASTASFGITAFANGAGGSGAASLYAGTPPVAPFAAVGGDGASGFVSITEYVL